MQLNPEDDHDYKDIVTAQSAAHVKKKFLSDAYFKQPVLSHLKFCFSIIE
jgi:hypothetical protein